MSSGGDVPEAFSISNPSVEKLIRETAGHAADITDTTRDYLKSFLADAYKNGDGIDDMVRGLERDDNFAFGSARAENIARTEIVGASNNGNLQGYKQSGVVNEKTWMATPGTEGSRDSHEALDGSVIGIDDEWEDSATGAHAQCPGSFGDPASDCNCRCGVSAFIRDPDKAVAPHGHSLHQSHAEIEKQRAPHEDALRAKVAGILGAQRAKVISALRAVRNSH